MGLVPDTMLPCRTDDQVVRIVAVNGTHRLPRLTRSRPADIDVRAAGCARCPLCAARG